MRCSALSCRHFVSRWCHNLRKTLLLSDYLLAFEWWLAQVVDIRWDGSLPKIAVILWVLVCVVLACLGLQIRLEFGWHEQIVGNYWGFNSLRSRPILTQFVGIIVIHIILLMLMVELTRTRCWSVCSAWSYHLGVDRSVWDSLRWGNLYFILGCLALNMPFFKCQLWLVVFRLLI